MIEQSFYFVKQEELNGLDEGFLIHVSNLKAIEAITEKGSKNISARFSFSARKEDQYSINASSQKMFNLDKIIENVYNCEPIQFNKNFIMVTDAHNIENLDKENLHKASKILINIKDILIARKIKDEYSIDTYEKRYVISESPEEIYNLLLNNSPNNQSQIKEVKTIKSWNL